MIDPALSRRGLAGVGLVLVLIAVLTLLAVDLEVIWGRSLLWIMTTQRELHRALSDAIEAVRHAEAGALWWMVSISFLYGVFHAAGPGHGKIVISTYLATHESRLGRGIALTVLSSLTQGLTAIVAVGVAILLLDLSMRETQSATLVLESASYGLVELLGLMLCWRSGRRLMTGGGDDGRLHVHHHDADCGCSHHHGPSAADLAVRATPLQFIMTMLSIGIRPCSGAVLVLLLAFSMGRPGAGIASVMAMAVGTAITVSALATLSVYARQSALAILTTFEQSERRLARVVSHVAMIGGLILVIAGSSLLSASRKVAQHPLL